MPQNTISTYLRCRPCKRPSGFFELGEDGVVQVEVPKESVAGMVNHKRNKWRFGFDGLIGTEATQDEVFETVARPVVESVIEGFNGTPHGHTSARARLLRLPRQLRAAPRSQAEMSCHWAPSQSHVEPALRAAAPPARPPTAACAAAATASFPEHSRHSFRLRPDRFGQDVHTDVSTPSLVVAS